MAMGKWAAVAAVVVIGGGALIGVNYALGSRTEADQERLFSRCDGLVRGEEQISADRQQSVLESCQEAGWEPPTNEEG